MDDISIIGVGKDAYNDDLLGMVEGRILPWVEDTLFGQIMVLFREAHIFLIEMVNWSIR